MLEFLKRLFDSAGRSEPRRETSAVMASDDLGRVEQELEKAQRSRDVARLSNRAGDLHLNKGDRQHALQRYGRAIDAYLESGEYDNAMAVCRKIIRVVPEVIRTRRTLAWLCLGKGFLEIAREHVEAYIELSRESGLEDLAIQQLQLMAQYVDREEFREFLADKLEQLDDPETAKRVREGKATEDVSRAGWTPVVFAAMLTPEELRRATERGVDIEAPGHEKQTSDTFDALLFDPDNPDHEDAPEGEKSDSR